MKTKLMIIGVVLITLFILAGCKATYTVTINDVAVGTTKYDDNSEDEIVNPILVDKKEIDNDAKTADFTLVSGAELVQDYTYKSKVAISQHTSRYTTFIRIGKSTVPQTHKRYHITYHNYGLNGEDLGEQEERVDYSTYNNFKESVETWETLYAIQFNGKYYKAI